MYKKNITQEMGIDVLFIRKWLERSRKLEPFTVPKDDTDSLEDHLMHQGNGTETRQGYKYMGTYFEPNGESIVLYSKGNPNITGYELALTAMEVKSLCHYVAHHLFPRKHHSH